MKSTDRFSANVASAIRESKILRIRAGTDPHRFIGIWVVVVDGRVFVRSYTLNTRSWYRAFLDEPRGAIQIGAREIAVRAVPTRSERLKSAVDRAYAEKYKTPGSLKYVRGFLLPKQKATTTELVPARTRIGHARASRG